MYSSQLFQRFLHSPVHSAASFGVIMSMLILGTGFVVEGYGDN